MATRKNNAPSGAPSPSPAEAAERRRRHSAHPAPCFHELENDLPIAGTPAPRPCPFSGSRDDISVVLERRSDSAGGSYVCAHVQCDHCGCEAGYAASIDDSVAEAIEAGEGSGPYCTVMAATRRWNERRGS